MSTASDHLDKAAAFIAVAESGDAKIAAYKQAADEIIAARESGPLSGRQVGERIGKSTDWVNRLLRWRASEDHHLRSPFAGGEPQRRYAERQVPTRPEDRVEMARTLLEDEAVTEAIVAEPTLASRRVERAVEGKQAARREQHREHRERDDHARALPLPAQVARMMVKLTEFTLDLQRLHGHFDQLTDREQRIAVADKHRALIDAAEQNVAALDPPPELAEDVIEGTVAGEGRP